MIQAILDHALQSLQKGEVHAGLHEVFTQLQHLRDREPDDRWSALIRPACEAHPIIRLMLEDPLTQRCREKPRGYAGDAPMIEYLYSQVPPPGTSKLGQQVFAYTTNSPAGRAVRWRLAYLAESIDRVANANPDCRVLSLACGHLREAGLSAAVRAGKVSGLFAVDQDLDSLAVARQDYAHLPCVHTAEGTVRAVLKAGAPKRGLHLAYAAGLYDYLEARVASALTERLFDALAPGGRLIVPNFLRTNFTRGYMESFMDWHLIVRDRAEIEAIGAALPEDQIAERRYFEDPYSVIGYLEILKRA